MKMRLPFCLSLLSLLSACATYRPIIPIEAGKEPSIQESDLYIVTNPEKIVFLHDSSNITQAAGGGLLFALIDAEVENARTKKAMKLGAPIQEALKNVDIESQIKDWAEKNLRQEEWIKVQNVRVGLSEEIDALVKENKKAIIKLSMTPTLSPDFSMFRIANLLEIYAKGQGGQLKELPEPIYRITMDDVTKIIENAKKPEDNAEYWAKNGASEAKSALSLALEQSFTKIKKALEDPTRIP